MTKRNYGWLPQIGDIRDYNFPVPPTVAKYPAKLDLRKGFPKVFDQGALGSCTANAVVAAFYYAVKTKKLRNFSGSRLYNYYYARLIRGWQDFDSGAFLRDSIATLKANGLSTEHTWPYKIPSFTTAPDAKAIKSAGSANHAAIQYRAVNRDISSFKVALNQGLPIVIGFTVYESFEYGTWKDVMPMPLPNEGTLGGHAVVICGYDDAKAAFLVRNSWGSAWKLKGYFYMPYAYILNANLSSDFWVIENIGTRV